MTTLPRRAVPQPKPAINQGGDCGGCVLAGLLDLSVKDVYEMFRAGGHKSFSRYEMVEAVESALWTHELLDRVITDIPHWIALPNSQIWGHPGWAQNLAWFNYIRMAIDAGYYGIASITYNKQGPPTESDHVVLICGARERREQHPTVASAKNIIQEILVSCSAAHPDGKWVNHIEFLEKWGGFNAILVRPSPTKKTQQPYGTQKVTRP